MVFSEVSGVFREISRSFRAFAGGLRESYGIYRVVSRDLNMVSEVFQEGCFMNILKVSRAFYAISGGLRDYLGSF